MDNNTKTPEGAIVTLHQPTEEEKTKIRELANDLYWMDWQSSMRTSYEKGIAAAKRQNSEKHHRQTNYETLYADFETLYAGFETWRAGFETWRAAFETWRADFAEMEVLRLKKEIAKLKQS